MGENISLIIFFFMLKILKIIFLNFIYENDEVKSYYYIFFKKLNWLGLNKILIFIYILLL